MPVLGVASKLRQPAIGSKPVHTAPPIPNLGIGVSQQRSLRPLEFATPECSMLSCQLTLKSTCEFGEKRAPQRTAKEREDSKFTLLLQILGKKELSFIGILVTGAWMRNSISWESFIIA
ncbi:Neuron navigator 3 [Microtus ochrogaster]|uniref:Neuron navigator 3 n=1 Tax=Microtus ochrogaster TaxID=79684 RepID=A0A8J6KVA1_MICOH|nr:Neuron navigator 3 [Microtus ochrogaster]